jgi:hypothetical protein
MRASRTSAGAIGASQTRVVSRKVRRKHVRTFGFPCLARAQRRALQSCLALLLSCGLAWFCAPVLAHAADVLEIPESCGSASELTREVSLLRADSLRPDAARPEVQLRQQGDEFVLQVVLPQGTRTLRDTDCRALFRAAIVIAALGHESSAEGVLAQSSAEAVLEQSSAEAVQRAPEPVPAASAPSPAQVLAAPPRAPASALPERTRDKPPPARRRTPPGPARAYVSLQAELAYGVVPALSAALSAGLSWQRGLWGTRLVLGYLTPRTAEDGDQGVRIQALNASLSAEVIPLSWLHVALGLDLFVLSGRGVGVRNSRTDWTAQPAPHLGLRALVWQRDWFGLSLTSRALWSPQPSRFGLSGGGTLYAAEHFAFQLGLAASLQFL